MRCSVVCVLFLFVASCLYAQEDNTTLLGSLTLKRIEIDSLYEYGETKIFGKTDNGLVVKLENVDSIPDDVPTVFLLLVDSRGEVVSSIESIISESGDWYSELIHYYDDGGKTFAFQEFMSTFLNSCTDLPANEMTFRYFQDNKMIGEQRTLADDSGTVLNDSCIWRYKNEHTVYPNAREFIKANRLTQ